MDSYFHASDITAFNDMLLKDKEQIVLARLSDQRTSRYTAIRQAMPGNDSHRHPAMPLADPLLVYVRDNYNVLK